VILAGPRGRTLQRRRPAGDDDEAVVILAGLGGRTLPCLSKQFFYLPHVGHTGTAVMILGLDAARGEGVGVWTFS